MLDTPEARNLAMGWERAQTRVKLAAIEAYKNALALGYTESLPEIYKTAGVPFDFSSNRLQELAKLIQAELKKLQ